jgi:hypothetical protein
MSTTLNDARFTRDTWVGSDGTTAEDARLAGERTLSVVATAWTWPGDVKRVSTDLHLHEAFDQVDAANHGHFVAFTFEGSETLDRASIYLRPEQALALLDALGKALA